MGSTKQCVIWRTSHPCQRSFNFNFAMAATVFIFAMAINDARMPFASENEPRRFLSRQLYAEEHTVIFRLAFIVAIGRMLVATIVIGQML